jgi:3-phosphoinositide dependent protein kinase-1
MRTDAVSETESAADLRQRGNHEFQQHNYEHAVVLYTEALRVAATSPDTLDTPELVLNHLNRAAAYGQQQNYPAALEDAKQAWDLSQHTSVKAAYRLAKTYRQLHQYADAKAIIQAGLKALQQQSPVPEASGGDEDPNDVTFQQQHQALQDLWTQVLQAALEQSSDSKEPKDTTPETSIEDVTRGVSIREFRVHQELGYGNFSQIQVVTHRITNERFALKRIEKKRCEELAKRQHPNVYNEVNMERRVLLQRLPRHPNVVKMFHAFQDYTTLYYLMELHDAWSDLWSELRDLPGNEGWSSPSPKSRMVGAHRSCAQIWMYQLLAAVEHCHKHGVVHRDLKPENILLNGRGHVILIDFGTAKDLLETDLNGPEFVGTPDFMSPEAVKGTSSMAETEAARQDHGDVVGAGPAADLWALGCLLYILHTGMTVFWTTSPYLAFLRIARGLVTRPVGIVDNDAWDLIQAWLRLDPQSRLGADVYIVQTPDGMDKPTMRSLPGGYDCIREHAYFAEYHHADDTVKAQTPIPTLRDLCVRSVAELAHRDAHHLDISDRHPPGDGSSHDMLRLSSRDRDMVLHVLDRQQRLRDPRVYARFFADPLMAPLNRIRPATRDVTGWTQMNDDQGKAPHALQNPDPHATPVPIDPIRLVYISNPLFGSQIWDGAMDDDERKLFLKQLKRCVATINRQRPKLVIVTGTIDAKCRKVLARIRDSIPILLNDGTAFCSFWILGVQCLALCTNPDKVQPDSDQIVWLREQLEQSRMSKHPVFGFTDRNPRTLPLRVTKRLARGRTLALIGPCQDHELGGSYTDTVTYDANETVDDCSIKSNESQEDDGDGFTMKVEASSENGLRWIVVDPEPDSWHTSFEPVTIASTPNE